MNKLPEIEVKIDTEAKVHTEANIRPNIDLDTILVNEIGEFGKFQLRTLVLAAITAVLAGFNSYEYIFTTARINSRCLIPECDGSQPEWSPDWLQYAIPASSSGSYDNCQRYANTTTVSQQIENDTCSSTLFDTNTLQPCEEYVYENMHSIAYDFGLACEEWRRSAIGTARNVGVFFGLLLNGYVSDRWGRRVGLTVAAFNTGWIGILRYWSKTYIVFTISEAMECLLGSGNYGSSYILAIELTGPTHRVIVGALINTCQSLGYSVLGLIAWAVPNWRNLTLTLYAPQLLTVLYFWFISESVRWYISKDRFVESEIILKKAANINGKELSEKSLQGLRESAEMAKKKKLEEERSTQEPWLIVQVFRYKPILLRCIILPVWWITSIFIRNGLTVNSVNLSGNRYLNYVAVSAVAIPGFWTAYFLMQKIGRKPMLIVAFWICAICQIAYIFMPQGQYAASLTLYLIGKFSIGMVTTSLQIYTNELLPTKYRNSFFSYSIMTSRIGAMIAPLAPAIGAQWFEALPYVLYSSLALVSGALVFVTPETFGCKLPDTFEEASEISFKNKIHN